MTSPSANASIYNDFSGLVALKREAREDSPEAIREVAKQFEAVFIQMMLKSMREASLGEGLLDGPNMDTYMGMYDQQISLELANGRGLGFSDMLVEQLGGGRKAVGESEQASTGKMPEVLERVRSLNRLSVVTAPVRTASDPGRPLPIFDTPADFVQSLLPEAQAAANELGTQPEVLIAQAALETGWGRSVIKREDGSSSFNLFNIKADGRWDGDRVTVSTLEFRDGVAQREKANFRAYDSFSESFNDYVDFLRSNPRYQKALEQAHDPEQFIHELHKAGYATDPEYAGKIGSIMKGEVIGALKLSAEVPIT